MGDIPENTEISDYAWWKAWSTNGYNATEAYLSLRPKVERTSAADLGSRRHKKFKKGEVYKSLEDKLLQNVNELLDSKDDKVKLAITKDSLDRLRGKAKESVDIKSDGKRLEAININVLVGEKLDEALEKAIILK